MSSCEHSPVYYGVINIRYRGEPLGYVDVWKCRKCGAIFAEERRFPPKIDESLGFKEPKGVLSVVVCRVREHYYWGLVDAVEGSTATVRCNGIECVMKIAKGLVPVVTEEDCGQIRLIPLTDIVNKNLEVAEAF